MKTDAEATAEFLIQDLGTGSLTNDQVARIAAAVEASFESQVQFLEQLVREPSTRGNENTVQKLVATALRARDFDVATFTIDPIAVATDASFSSTTFEFNSSDIVVGTKSPNGRVGRSLALNAHVDVVPEGPVGRWKYPPYTPTREGEWLYGRGAADMKAGLVANLFALDAISAAGFSLSGPIQFQSVIEEETTGNGAAMVLKKGFLADAVLTSEPTNERLVSANTGVIKFAITVQGVPAHPCDVTTGRSAIDVAVRVSEHLRRLEKIWNDNHPKIPGFEEVANPVALMIGKIAGGEWHSSVPSECRIEARMGFYPGDNPESRASELQRFVNEAFESDDLLSTCPPPTFEWIGVRQDGFVLAPGSIAESMLARAHSYSSAGADTLKRFVMPCYLDAAVFAVHGDMTALVYGPTAENLHAIDERVNLPSLLRVTKTIALFTAAWCGIVED